jgi:hypothetical protein
LTSPAEETDLLIKSPVSPMITKPPVPDSMADKPIALASDTDVIELSSVTSGTGGFVING